jgi:hypothetical protein
MNNHHGPVRSQVVVDEVCVRLGQPAPLDSEVTHPLGHQDVLQLIVHVVQHDVGIAPQQCWCDRPTELQRLIRAIGVADMRDRHKYGVGQPGHLHRRSKMSQRAVAGPEQDGRVALLRVAIGERDRYGGQVHIAEPPRIDPLGGADSGVDAPQHRPRQTASGTYGKSGQDRVAEVREGLAIKGGDCRRVQNACRIEGRDHLPGVEIAHAR